MTKFVVTLFPKFYKDFLRPGSLTDAEWLRDVHQLSPLQSPKTFPHLAANSIHSKHLLHPKEVHLMSTKAFVNGHNNLTERDCVFVVFRSYANPNFASMTLPESVKTFTIKAMNREYYS